MMRVSVDLDKDRKSEKLTVSLALRGFLAACESYIIHLTADPKDTIRTNAC